MLITDTVFIEITHLCRAIGLIGVGIYIIGFFCLCSGRLDSRSSTYFWLILTASSCVMASLLTEFNLSAALIQVFYAFMSLGGIALRLRPRSSNQDMAI